MPCWRLLIDKLLQEHTCRTQNAWRDPEGVAQHSKDFKHTDAEGKVRTKKTDHACGYHTAQQPTPLELPHQQVNGAVNLNDLELGGVSYQLHQEAPKAEIDLQLGCPARTGVTILEYLCTEAAES